MRVVVIGEIGKLAFQIRVRPEQDVVEVFAPDGTDQSHHEWM